jgi:hypothetical protein
MGGLCIKADRPFFLPKGLFERSRQMAYTPELSQQHSCTLRRIAWSLEMPMTQAMAHIFDYLAERIEALKVCEKCRDKTKCEDCAFNR